MPALLSRFCCIARRIPATAMWLIASCAQALNPSAAADVFVVTDSLHPVQAPTGVQIIALDAPTRIEAELSARLPADPDMAAHAVQQHLHDGGSELQRRLAHAYQAVADAWSLGVARIPAVVVDRRYVVYGDPDVARAIARIEAYRRTAP